MMARIILLLASSLFLFPGIAWAAEPEPQVFRGDNFHFTDIEADGEYVVLIRGESADLSVPASLEFYTRDSEGTWFVQQTLAPAEGGTFDLLEMDGDFLVAGRDDAVFVFERDAASGLWSQATTLTFTGSDGEGGIVGIAIDGDHIAIAEAFPDEDPATPEGAIHYFERNAATLAWERLATRNTSSRAPVSLDVSGQRVAYADTRGIVRTLEYNGTDLENAFQLAGIADTGGGLEVRLEGDVMAVASPFDTLPDYPPWSIGQVYLFEVQDNGSTWDNVETFSSLQPAHRSEFGHDMEMNDGIVAVVEGFEGGSVVSLIRKNEAGEWTRFATPDCACLGYGLRTAGHVSVSADALAVGSSRYSHILKIYDMAALMGTAGDDEETGNPNDGEEDEENQGDDVDNDTGDNGNDETGDNPGGAPGDDGDGGSDEGGGNDDAGSDASTETGGDGETGGGGETGDASGSQDNTAGSMPEDDGGGGGALTWALGLVVLAARKRLEK